MKVVYLWVALKRQRPNDVGLAFLLTAAGYWTYELGFYTYLAPAGAKVTVYVMSSCLDFQLSEFSPGRVRWIYGMEAKETKPDSSDRELSYLEHAKAQKFGGKSYGVAMKIPFSNCQDPGQR